MKELMSRFEKLEGPSLPGPMVQEDSKLLAPLKSDYALFGGQTFSNKPIDVNRGIWFKQKLRNMLADTKPTLQEFQALQSRALNDLSMIAGWVDDIPDMDLPDRVLATLDPKKVREIRLKCFEKYKKGPPGAFLGKPDCVHRNTPTMGEDGFYYISDGKSWKRMNDPTTQKPLQRSQL